MSLLSFMKNEAKVQVAKLQLSSQKGQISKLRNDLKKLQMLVRDDILSLTDRSTSYKGNEYTTYTAAVTEIESKYNGTADWGAMQTGNIIDIRAAFIINEGPKVVEKQPGAEKEIEWANKFLEDNDLDKEVCQEYAKEAEIEAKLALKLKFIQAKDDKEAYITARYISWTDKKYEVITDPQDYLDYQKLTWKPTSKLKGETLEAKEFVYKKFGGRINKPDQAAPKIMKCLTQIEHLDQALRDWREINRIFASPILYWEIDGQSTNATNLLNSAKTVLEDKNFKVKKAIAGIGKLQYLQLDIGGIESIEKEIITLAKMISGTTGVSVQYLGLADLLKNRATSTDLREMLVAVTTKEREIWKGAYEELIRKAMIMWNDANQKSGSTTALDPNKIGVEIPIITEQQWEHLEKIFLPSALAGKISDETFLEKIPGIDVKKEMERKAEKEASEFERMKKENEDMKNERFEKDLFNKKGEEE